MKLNNLKKTLTLLVCIVLIAAMTLTFAGCASKNNPGSSNAGAANTDVTVLGEGKTVFNFTVVGSDGAETKFEIHTDETTVGAALQALKLIDGDMGEYGMYVKTVNGVTVDWDKDGKYWAFYIGDEYAMTSVDLTDITAGATYTFKVE